ncbi:MAG TPA: enoyl-CoA hydratase/isomerase family protein [Phycisphaerales bacterium]|nr:enoyl-CoA hydratase/isomerase family protein [Phycisphaerales bacterium]
MIRVSMKDISAGAGRIGLITLDRPEKKNALTPEMLDRLIGAVGEVRQASAIVLEGNGAAFCAGFDLTLCRENSDALRVLLTGLSRAIRVLRACEGPVVIAAHGAALAGGCALLGGADYVVTHTEAKIGYPVVRLGVSPAVSAPFLRQSIGDGRTRERMLDSSLISGWDALRMGLAHECIEDAGKVRDRAMVVAEQFTAKPRWGLAATKRWMNEVDGSGDDARAEGGLEASLALVGSPEERERLAALWKN